MEGWDGRASGEGIFVRGIVRVACTRVRSRRGWTQHRHTRARARQQRTRNDRRADERPDQRRRRIHRQLLPPRADVADGTDGVGVGHCGHGHGSATQRAGGQEGVHPPDLASDAVRQAAQPAEGRQHGNESAEWYPIGKSAHADLGHHGAAHEESLRVELQTNGWDAAIRAGQLLHVLPHGG